MTTTAKNQSFTEELIAQLSGEVLTDELSLGIYSTDASVYQIQPICIVLPKSEFDVIQAVKIAKEHQVNVLPRGAGTSLAGQTVGRSMIIDFSKYLNSVLEINESERWARVQPGIARDDLNAILKNHQLHFAPDPATSSRANIGGMIGNNSSGTKSILYGKTVDHILELKIILTDCQILHFETLNQEAYDQKAAQPDKEGKIYREFKKLIQTNEDLIEAAFPKVMRRVQGYNLDEFIGDKKGWNLSKIICGSEGTLATILEAKINLEPLPKFKSVCVVHFARVLEAIEAVNPMLQFQPAAVEILDKTVLDLSRENLTTQRSAHFIEGDPAAIQIVEFYSESEKDALERPNKMVDHLKSLGLGYAYPIFPEGKNYNDVWLIRKKGLGLMLGIKGKKKPLAFIEDSGIPTKFLPEYIDAVLKVCKKHQTEAAMYAHASVGVIHVRPILDLRQAEDIQRFKQISEETFDLVKKYGGSWSGEHGDGLVRSYKLKDFFGEEVYQILKSVKQIFDPDNRMNPGKIIDAQAIDENLRYGEAYQDQSLETIFHYRQDESFEDSVHMCSGVGECRKLLGGTMCPSFKATRDEIHSTRGRANALRLAMSGQLQQEEKGLTNEQVINALDLCLSCKACKSECPSNVDMAKLKSEVWQQKYDKNGISMRERFIRDSSLFAQRFSGFAAEFINTIQKSYPFRFLLDQFVGIEKERMLPEYTAEPFFKWFSKNYRSENATKKVVLFADTYLNFHEPNIGIAATKLLDTLGYEVILANVGCCQRPKISNGFLKDAKRAGAIVAQQLDQFIQKGLKVLVCEPSCASALTDDLPDLLDDENLAIRLMSNIQMIDVFIHQEVEKGNITAPLNSKFENIQIHGHCHQKAIYGTKAMKMLLSDCNVQEIPSGCCGMAGSFGYEKEHFQLSEKIGEEILFPAVRKMKSEEALVACGVSCRQQIQHFTQRKALHWVELFELE